MKTLLFLLLSVSALRAQEPAEFYIGEGLSVALIAADWKATRGIAKREGHYESNFILGKKPTPTKVDIYMATAIVAHVFISKKLPRHWRYALWGATITLQTYVVWSNHKNGMRVL